MMYLLKVLAMEAFMQETAVMDTSATSRIGEQQDKKTGQSEMANQTIRFLRE
jgi:hypothetical protein